MAKATGMKWGDIKAALDGDDEDAKASAYAAIKAAFPDEEPDGDEKKEGEDAPEKKDAADEPEKKDGEDAPEKKDAKKCADDEPSKKDSRDAAALIAAQDARIRQLEADAAKRQKRDDEEERKRLIASREVSSELAKALAGKPLEYVREICAALPARKSARPISTETVQATRGGHGDGGEAPRLSEEESRKLAERMGLRKADAKIGWDPNMKTTRVFPVGAAQAAKKEIGK